MLLGDIGVGKTSLARRLVFGRFDANYKATIGVDIYNHELTVPEAAGDSRVELVIWDIDGDFGETIFRHVYIRGASAALVIGDAVRPSTLESMIRLGDRFQDELPGRPVAFVVNKMGLVETPETFELPKALISPRIPCIRASAKSGSNVEAAFSGLAGTILERGL